MAKLEGAEQASASVARVLAGTIAMRPSMTMAVSRVSLLVLVYVTLDFANPLMPGAVSFDRGSVDVVQGDRARPAAVVPVCITPTPETVVERPRDAEAVHRPSLTVDRRRDAVIRIRHAPLSCSDPAVPPDDH
jgi:hypothetical protein